MTRYLDLETAEEALDLPVFDVVIVGAGAAGLTVARELGSRGVRTCVIESGAFEESPEHEALNAVEVDGILLDPKVQQLREAWHSWQLKYWTADLQRFGVRTRVFGGSTAAWAGRAAPFDALDLEARPWIPDSGWPISRAELDPFIDRAGAVLNLGPMLNDRRFWKATNREVPDPVQRLTHFDSFFWQFAKSSFELTRVKHFGWDFRRETFKSVTVLLNATAASVALTDGKASGVSLLSSRTSRKFAVDAPIVVVAAGAIENARLLLLSGLSEPDATAPAGRPAIGRYLIDHPTARLGSFDATNRDIAFRLLGFYALPNSNRVSMYSHGLALRPEAQEGFTLPNMAAFAVPRMAADDPLAAIKRLVRGKSDRPLRDIGAVVSNIGLIATTAGRKALEHPKIPLHIRRRMIDLVVRTNANLVALDYLSSGRSRKIDDLRVELIVEQPPQLENGVKLSKARDRLGLPKAEIHWHVGDAVREAIVKAGNLLTADLKRAGFEDFRPAPAFASNRAADLVAWDMGHTAGTTRMGADPETSVVDKDCQVHGVAGLYVAGASTFPTVGHANPTLMIVAMAVRLADRLLSVVGASRAATGSKTKAADDWDKPLVLVTGATGHLGRDVVNALCDRGYPVRAQYRKRPPDDGRVDWVRVDFADPDLSPEVLDGLVAGADAVIHLAASLANNADEMETTNVVNLERLADACVRNGVRYFGQASSMVVYGSPRVGLVSEDTPLIDLSRPIEKQFAADPHLRNYARSKRVGEDVLTRYGDRMHVDLCRITVAYQGVIEGCLSWGRLRRMYSMYRNTHFVSPQTVARAFVHLMERSLATDCKGVEAYNVCDGDSPTFADLYRRVGRSPGIHVPLLIDYLRNMYIAKGLFLRRPHGAFRVDDRKLKAAGFRDS